MYALPIALLTLVPLLVVLGYFLYPQAEIWQHLARHVLPRVVLNTAKLMALVAIGVLAVGVPLAWLTAVCDFPGRRFFAWALMLPLAIPAYVLAFVQMGLFDFAGPAQTWARAWFGTSAFFPGLRNHAGVAAAVLTMALYPYVYLLARNAFQTQGRRALEAARTLGLPRWRAFAQVAVPMARPWIAGGLMLVMMETLADFGAVAVLNYDTFTTAIYKSWFGLFNLPGAAQLASLLVLCVLLIAALEQRQRGRRQYQVAYGHSPRVRLGRAAGWLACAACLLVLLIAFAIPVLQLALWAGSVWRDELDARYWQFAANSVTLSFSAAAVATALAVCLAWLRRRYDDAATAWTIRLAVLGYAVPGAVLAVGVFIPIAWLDERLAPLAQAFGLAGAPVLKGTLAAMLLALVARFLTVAYQASDSAMQRVTRSQDDAARSLGLGPRQRLARIYLPLMRPGLFAAFLLVFVDVLKEMPITLMTRTFGWDTLAVRIYQLTAESMWQSAALPAAFIVLVGLLPVALLVRETDARPTTLRR
ncbi:iron ABC transporter permease [Verticiella sediminum]|uniref:Iron ABC transporter permease n=1 Tax=Verticiella sediminum TaxID=1247510 RepID=A0A556A8D0_9BURK|nr:iron ABC transporter permease [Verticiella sediminum]